ncbi:N-6 DNA methylase [Streptococcus sp. DD11]|uniref:Eco57I restriction-modification methylase domain-containing protein n=1 Tax=Streptococcus sp. DD11 TaxID=1777879 RepID=UPI000A8C18FB|nr:N-6 DNA methylase [Streptococcus sp. DD11]
MIEQQNFLKKNGIYYTNESLAKVMIDNLDIDYTSDFSIIEPAVGEGHIFCLIVEEFLKNNLDKSQAEIQNSLENRFSAFDIREDAITICISRLNKIVRKYFKEVRINWNIYVFDALDFPDKFDKRKTFDYVISNPPYISRKNMEESIVEKLRKSSDFCNRFNFDIYYYFFELGLSLWNKKGKISYITPNNYLRARGAEKLLQTMISNKYIEKIIDYGDLLNFEDATTYTAITIISENNNNLEIVDSDNNELKSFTYNELHKKEIYYLYDEKFIYEEGESILLGEIADIKNGLATLQDSVFIINEQEIVKSLEDKYLIEKKSHQFLIEKSILKKGVRVSNPGDKYYIVFPYDDENQKIIDISEKYPYTYDYLRNELSDKFQERYDIYFGRTQGMLNYSSQKITIPKVANLEGKPFKQVDSGFVLAGISIVFTEKLSQLSCEKILKYLNSKLVLNYLRGVSKNYSSGYKNMSTRDLKKIRIPIDLYIEE